MHLPSLSTFRVYTCWILKLLLRNSWQIRPNIPREFSVSSCTWQNPEFGCTT
jgi:hypothetical protein